MTTTLDTPTIAASEWAVVLSSYERSSNWRAFIELGITLIPFLGLVVAIHAAVFAGYWLALLLIIPASGLLLRLFMIQHDCGHQALFSHRWLNLWVGRVLGVFTLTPFDYWLHNHAIHHMSSGNLDRRGVGDIDTLTVEEFFSRTSFQRVLYRIYRNPITLFLIGPAYVFLLQHRLPIRMMKRGWMPWMSTLGTNLGVLVLSAVAVWLTSLGTFLIVMLPTVLMGAMFGVWLFFIQHQFEETIWDETSGWDRQEAALYGSSHYDLPPVLRWFTGNIGVHHVHHLNSKIPFFRLSKVLADHPALRDINRISLWDSLSLVNLALWDSQKRKLVSFSQAIATWKSPTQTA